MLYKTSNEPRDFFTNRLLSVTDAALVILSQSIVNGLLARHIGQPVAVPITANGVSLHVLHGDCELKQTLYDNN